MDIRYLAKNDYPIPGYKKYNCHQKYMWQIKNIIVAYRQWCTVEVFREPLIIYIFMRKPGIPVHLTAFFEAILYLKRDISIICYWLYIKTDALSSGNPVFPLTWENNMSEMLYQHIIISPFTIEKRWIAWR